MRRRFRYFAAVLVAAIGVIAATGVVSAGDAPTAMLLLDGSGSMWARLPPDNRAKIDIVRDKLTTILQTPSSTRVGLVSFGHRRRGDCSDVEVIAPPDSARDGVLGPIAKLNPTGPGPLTAGLKAAVDAIGTARPAQIVVVGDGADNCHQDSCSAAADIAKNSPGITIQVIEIGVPAADRGRVACIAEATGGHYYDITDSNGLNAALDEAAKLAILSPGATPEAAAGTNAAPPPPAGASLRASAALAEGGALLAVPIRWKIFKSGDTAVLGESQGPDISAKLPAGNYDVEAKLGSLSARQQVRLEAGSPQSIIVPLNGAHLNIRAAATKGGEASSTAILTVASGDTSVAIARNGAADLYLPPASYTVTVADGVARTSRSVTLTAGDDKPVAIGLGTGHLEVTATTGDAAQPIEDILYTIFEDDPESPDGRRQVARSRAPNASFTLPAGTYYISARSGAADVRERIAVGVGEVVKRTLSLALAPLKISTIVAGAPAKAKQGVLYRVDRLDGDKARVARAIGPEFALRLPPGQYTVTASIASCDLSASQVVTLEAGKPAAVQLEIPSGGVTFRPPPGEAAATGDIYWEVIDAKGVPLWRAMGVEAEALLAPGHYTVRLEARGKHNAAAFDVRAGENQQIEIGPG
jgi:Ca-activated chloride channel family protein